MVLREERRGRERKKREGFISQQRNELQIGISMNTGLGCVINIREKMKAYPKSTAVLPHLLPEFTTKYVLTLQFYARFLCRIVIMHQLSINILTYPIFVIQYFKLHHMHNSLGLIASIAFNRVFQLTDRVVDAKRSYCLFIYLFLHNNMKCVVPLGYKCCG